MILQNIKQSLLLNILFNIFGVFKITTGHFLNYDVIWWLTAQLPTPTPE